jgi:transcriptional regulator with XRE-family HTH domain
MEKAMKRLGYTRKNLAAELKRSQEHVRKLVEGEAFPGPDLQNRIAAVLQISADEFRQAVDSERYFRKTGRKPPLPEKPRVSPIDRVWERLTPEQRQVLECVASCMVKAPR